MQCYYIMKDIDGMLKYYYKPSEFWAFTFADSCTGGHLQSVGHQYLKKELNIKSKKINENINKLIYLWRIK